MAERVLDQAQHWQDRPFPKSSAFRRSRSPLSDCMRVGQRLDWGWAMSSLVQGTGLRRASPREDRFTRADRLLSRLNRFASGWLQACWEDVFPALITCGAATVQSAAF